MSSNKPKFAVNIEGVPINLFDSVQYQEGSIVSREIFQKAGGSITIFSFSEDQGLSEHVSPYEASAYILEGSCKITIAGKEFHVNAGEIIIMPANVPHAVQAITQFKMLLIMIREKK